MGTNGDAASLHHLGDRNIGHFELQRPVHGPAGQQADHLTLTYDRVSLVAGAPHALGGVGNRVLGREHLYASGHHLGNSDARPHDFWQQTQQLLAHCL